MISRVCVYFTSGDAVLHGSPLYRAKTFRAATPDSIGSSPGWTDPSNGTTDPGVAITQSVAAYKALQPSYSTECPTFPIVMVPGYLSTTVEYSIKNSPPPPGHPLCSRSTSGWTTLYPPTAKDILQPACYTSLLDLTLDNSTKEFKPSRANMATQVEDFGGFDSIKSFAGVVQFFESAGWTTGKTLFGVPFDWRKPSVAQASMFSSMKLLVENVSALNNGDRVVLWSVSGGPQWVLSFLHRMDQVSPTDFT